MQYEKLKNVATLGVDPLLRNSDFYEHICMGNIKKLYRSAVKRDDQHQYKAILEAAIASTPEELNNKIPMPPDQFDPA